jgi:hypothetical protein
MQARAKGEANEMSVLICNGIVVCGGFVVLKAYTFGTQGTTCTIMAIHV